MLGSSSKKEDIERACDESKNNIDKESAARMLNNTGKSCATSYESHNTLNRIYPNFYSTVNELSSYKNVTMLHDADATDIQGSASSRSLDKIKFHRIIFNFPCQAVSEGQDGQVMCYSIINMILMMLILLVQNLILYFHFRINTLYKTNIWCLNFYKVQINYYCIMMEKFI